MKKTLYNVSYFSKNNRSLESYFWAGFIYKKNPFYKKKNKWYMKLRFPKYQLDLLKKFINDTHIVTKIFQDKTRYFISFEASKWKSDLDLFYLSICTLNHTSDLLFSFFIGWLSSCKFFKSKHKKKGYINNIPFNYIPAFFIYKKFYSLCSSSFLFKLSRKKQKLNLTLDMLIIFITKLMLKYKVFSLLSDSDKQYCYDVIMLNSSSEN